MKLYRNYKNKPYKYIGVAKHSETLEDLVIYECLYDNPSAKLWVRPKEMFFENVTIDRKSVPRFAQIPLTLQTTTEITEAQITTVSAPLMENIFGQWDAKWFYSTYKNHTKFQLLTALVDDKAIGFKLGYELDQDCFYSWLGGVLPTHQGLGIAHDLMVAQHQWCREQGYKRVQTKTQNRFKNMLMLNLSAGFDVIGVHASDEGGDKIVMQKML
jgi:GNAT superfamily N-acetyltransferase